MGAPAVDMGVEAEKLEEFRRKIEEYRFLGIDTAELERVLAERPQDFEKVAEGLLRRELTGGAPPEETPAEQAPSTEVLRAEEPAPPLEEAPAPVSPAPPVEGERATAAPEPEGELPSPAADQPTSPVSDVTEAEQRALEELVELERKIDELAAATAAAAAPPEPQRTPAQTEIPPSPEPLPGKSSAEEAVEEALAEELDAALGQAAAPPPLVEGDAFSLAKSETPVAVPQAPAGRRPPPPGAAAPAAGSARPVKRGVVRPVSTNKPPGAKPAAAAAGESPPPESFPTQARHRSKLSSAALALLIVLAGVGVYLITANAPPVADFTYTQGPLTAGLEITFDASRSHDPNGDRISYNWSFGDNATASGTVAKHTYLRSENYTVTLTVRDTRGGTNAKTATLGVTAGTVAPLVYRYGDALTYAVTGFFHVWAPPGSSLATFTAGIEGFGANQTYGVTDVNISYTGIQQRSILADPASIADGFNDTWMTYVKERRANLNLDGKVENTSPRSPLGLTGPADLLESEYANPVNNDTVRAETFEKTTLTLSGTNPPKVLDSSAHLIEYPNLGDAANQLHFEEIYAGKAFDTETIRNGSLYKEGHNWTWVTQGTEIVGGALTLKISITMPSSDRPAGVTRFEIVLWVSSTSSFPLKERFYVYGIQPGKTYESLYTATASAAPVPGVQDINFGDGSRSYRRVSPSELALLATVPRAAAGADLSFTPEKAVSDAQGQSPDFSAYLARNPEAYTVNATYGLNAGNPRWIFDFAVSKSSDERFRFSDECSSPSTCQVLVSSPQASASRSQAEIGQVVSLNYAAGLIKLEELGSALFPSGVFDAAHANFTIRADLELPGISLNPAAASVRDAVPYAYGAESLSSEPVRTTAFVDARTGQLIYSLRETGDALL